MSAQQSSPPSSPPLDPPEGRAADGPPQDGPRGGGLSLRTLLVLAAIVAVAGGVALLSMSGGGSTGGVPGVRSARYAGLLLNPPKAEAPLALRNYRGEAVNIDRYRGRAVLVTFLYTKCPDVCPLIASTLGAALNALGRAEASKVQVIAVSVDPRGDTPQAVAAFLARHGVTGRMQYLIGSAHELAGVWQAWGVGSERDAQQPQFINHTGLVYGVSASGRVTTVYAASFVPREIVHDVPLLASS